MAAIFSIMLQYLTFIDFNEKTIRKMSPIWFSTTFLDFIQYSARFKDDLIRSNGGMLEWNGGTADLITEDTEYSKTRKI